MKIKTSTIARIGALIVALINQCLILFGQNSLPFTENATYQAVSLAVTIIIAIINAWENNDITRIAILSGKVFDALDDGKLTEEEIEKVLADAENAEE